MLVDYASSPAEHEGEGEVLAGCRVKHHPIDWFPFPEIFVRGQAAGRARNRSLCVT
jgi:hypothetical protein